MSNFKGLNNQQVNCYFFLTALCSNTSSDAGLEPLQSANQTSNTTFIKPIVDCISH